MHLINSDLLMMTVDLTESYDNIFDTE